MLDVVGRQLFSSVFKKTISNGVNSAIAHKVVDDVVNGATSTSQKVGKAVMQKVQRQPGRKLYKVLLITP